MSDLISADQFVPPAGRLFSYQGHGTSAVAARSRSQERVTLLMFTDADELMVYQRNWERRGLFGRRRRDLGVRVLYQGKSITETVAVLNEQLDGAVRDGWCVPLGGVRRPDGHAYPARSPRARWTERELIEWLEWVMRQRDAERQLHERAGLTVERPQPTEQQRLAGQVAALAYRYSKDPDAEVGDFERALNELTGYRPAGGGQLQLELSS